MAWLKRENKQRAEELPRVSRGLQPSQEVLEASSVEIEDDSITSAVLYGYSTHIITGDFPKIFHEVDEFLARGGVFESLVTLTEKLGEKLLELEGGDREKVIRHGDTLYTISRRIIRDPNEIRFIARKKESIYIEYALPEESVARVLVGIPHAVSPEEMHLEVASGDFVIVPFESITGAGFTSRSSIGDQFALRLSITDDDEITCDVKPLYELEEVFEGLESYESDEERDAPVDDLWANREFFYFEVSWDTPLEFEKALGRKLYFEVIKHYGYEEQGIYSARVDTFHSVRVISMGLGCADEAYFTSLKGDLELKFGDTVRYCFLDED